MLIARMMEHRQQAEQYCGIKVNGGQVTKKMLYTFTAVEGPSSMCLVWRKLDQPSGYPGSKHLCTFFSQQDGDDKSPHPHLLQHELRHLARLLSLRDVKLPIVPQILPTSTHLPPAQSLSSNRTHVSFMLKGKDILICTTGDDDAAVADAYSQEAVGRRFERLRS
jgi:hypothetical protein